MRHQDVESVVSLLISNGYELAHSPLSVGGLDFDFPAVLLGGPGNPELVIVVDTVMSQDVLFVTRQIEALARALDLIHSRRLLTTVLVGTSTNSATRSKLQRSGRVLLADQDAGLRDSLAILLPLVLPETSEATDAVARVQERLADMPSFIQSLLAASYSTTGDVQAELISALAEPLVIGRRTDQYAVEGDNS